VAIRLLADGRVPHLGGAVPRRRSQASR
jgi:hypothetical protein